MPFQCNHAIRVLESKTVPQRRAASKILDLRPGDIRIVEKYRYRCLVCEQTTELWFLEPQEAFQALARQLVEVPQKRLRECQDLLAWIFQDDPSALHDLVPAPPLAGACVDAPAASDEPSTEHQAFQKSLLDDSEEPIPLL